MTERSAVKRKQRQPKKAPKTPEFFDTDSDTEDEEEQEPAVKRKQRHLQKAPKFPEFVNKDLDTEDEEEEPVVKRILKLTKNDTDPEH